MVVVCRFNKLELIQDLKLRRLVAKNIHQSEIDLLPGKQYPVLGVNFFDKIPWFYICANDEVPYPKPYCMIFLI